MTKLENILALAMLSVAFGSCAHDGVWEPVPLPGEAAAEVRVLIDRGVVEVSRVSGPLVLERRLRGLTLGSRWQGEVVDGVLTVDARCAPVLPCSNEVRLGVGGSTLVEVELGEGEVWLHDVPRAQVAVSQGRVDGSIRDAATIDVGRGSARLDLGSGAAASVAVGSGDVALTVADASISLDARVASIALEGVDTGTGAEVRVVAPGGRLSVTGTDGMALAP